MTVAKLASHIMESSTDRLHNMARLISVTT